MRIIADELNMNAVRICHSPQTEPQTAAHRAPCLHPTPNADSPHRATERATGDAEQTGKADTHGQRERHPGRQTQPERGQDRRQSRRVSAGTLGEIGQAGRRWDRPRQAEPPADRQSHAEPPRMPQRVQLPPQTQTGRREAQRAADGAFRARYRYIIPKDYMNGQHAIP